MDLARNKALVKRYFTMWNTGNTEEADEVLAPDYVDHAHPEVKGPDVVKSTLPKIRAAIPDFQITCEQIISEGDMVAVRGSMRRTLQGTVSHSHVIWLVRIAHGQMAEMWTGTEASR